MISYYKCEKCSFMDENWDTVHAHENQHITISSGWADDDVQTVEYDPKDPAYASVLHVKMRDDAIVEYKKVKLIKKAPLPEPAQE